jgi:hypothetical protein
MSQEQLEREVTLAAMGKQVLDNEAFKHFLTLRKAQIFETFCNTTKDQEDVREEAWRTMVNMNALEQYFKTTLETGRMAEVSLKQE